LPIKLRQGVGSNGSFLADFEGVELIGEAEGGVQAVEMIERKEPELVLPDT
jgi:YesN/AraC family two-component response regulator